MSDNAEPPGSSLPGVIEKDAEEGGRLLRDLLLLVALWAVFAYLVVPRLWEAYFHHHADYSEVARVSATANGHPGDPVNIALLGSESDVILAMTAAGWSPADPITFRTSLRIAADSVLRRADENAPVSDLFLFGRKQDLAFEKPVGGSPRKRHHVRYWSWDRLDNGQPVWFGAATFDERVGLSYTTGQVTHHIGPDVDAERDRIVAELTHADCTLGFDWVNRFHSQFEGRNGGGDAWRTDGRLATLVLQPCTAPAASGVSK